ncbi:MAG: D-glycerate dehydrogenase [Candidatus Cloacimonadota bacterium]|nr:D-glycerate dehydrogenase [Candidatus Cloacimonadota bacterium]
MKPKLFLTRKLPEKVMQELQNKFELRYNQEDRVLSKEEIIVGIKWCDILLCLLTDPIDAEVIAGNPELKGISNYAVGYNNIDVEAATKAGIPVCNTPGVLTETTADMAWALLFATARRVVEADRFTRAGKFQGWAPELFLGNDIFGKTLGIIGAGRIGKAVAKRARGFEMPILYTDRNSSQYLEKELKAKQVELDELLKNSDFVSLHVPLTPETKHLITIRQLRKMKKTSVLINTSRGAVIKEGDFVYALQNNQIGGAGMDVYEDEPELHPELPKCANVVLTPHIASASINTRTLMGLMAAKNAWQMWQGKKPKNIVNPEVFR